MLFYHGFGICAVIPGDPLGPTFQANCPSFIHCLRGRRQGIRNEESGVPHVKIQEQHCFIGELRLRVQSW